MIEESDLEFDVNNGISTPVLRLKTKRENFKHWAITCLIELFIIGLVVLFILFLWVWWNPIPTPRG